MISVQEPRGEEFKIKNLISLSGISINQARDIVKIGYDDLFSLAITSGIPLQITQNIFLNYIPIIKLLPTLDLQTLTQERIMNIFIVFTKNLISDEQIFDFLLLSCENPDKSMDDVIQLVHNLDQSRYYTILSRIKGTTDIQRPEFENRFIAGMATNKQERINKLLLLNSDLQIEDAMNIVENNDDELYFLSNQAGITFDLIQEILLRKLPLMKERGLDVTTLEDEKLILLLQDFYTAKLTKQELDNNIIMAILEPIFLIKDNTDKQQRMNQLLQITNNLHLDHATKLIDIEYEMIFNQARIAKISLILVLKILFKDIIDIKEEGFNIQGIDQGKILTVFTAYKSGLIKEEDIKDCLTLIAIKPDIPVLSIIKEGLSKSKIRAIKVEQIEKVEKEIQVLPELEGFGFKIEAQEGNCLLTLFHKSKPIGNAMLSPSIPSHRIIYLLTFELNLPFDMVNKNLKGSADIIQQAIKDII
jgi:Glu-tRNA(Gln) amidotransferase subunit E-like FAD-binding protein